MVKDFQDREEVSYLDIKEEGVKNAKALGVAMREGIKAKGAGSHCRGMDKYTGEFLGRVYYSERRYYNESEKPMLNVDGVAMVKCRKQDRGKSLEFRYYGVSDEPVRIKGLSEQVRFKSDDRGNLTSMEFLNANDQMVNVRACGCFFQKWNPMARMLS